MSIIFGLSGPHLTTVERRWLRSPNAAGVILFGRNYQDRQQLAALCGDIHALAPKVFISVDWEGGRVQRFREGFTPLPSMRAVGETYAVHQERGHRLAHALGLIIASELSCLDLSYTPVLDLYNPISQVIGDRAFSANPAEVFILSQALRQGLAAGGMAAVGKHYPGHGSIAPDSHHDVCRDERPESQRQQDELPFKLSIGDGIEALMTAHIITPDSDGLPASFSPTLLGRLRQSFGGALISDDLDMAGALTGASYPAKVQQALDAGADACLICNNFAAIDEALSASYRVDERSASRLQNLRRRHAPDPERYEAALGVLAAWQTNSSSSF